MNLCQWPLSISRISDPPVLNHGHWAIPTRYTLVGGCREKGYENTLPLMVGLPCVCLAKLYSCKQVRMYMWGADPKEWREQGEVQQVPRWWDHRISSHYQILVIKRNYQEVILSCQTPSKNSRSCLTSVTEPAHLVPWTKHIHSYPLTLSTHFSKIIRRVS